jgi:hypothetical protein
VPHVSRGVNCASKPAIVSQLEVASWKQYLENPKRPEIVPSRPSNLRSIYELFCELCEIMHRGMYILYAPQNELNSSHVLDIYKSYTAWYNSLPELLHVQPNSTPTVLFVQYFNHSSAILSPFTNFSLKYNLPFRRPHAVSSFHSPTLPQFANPTT